MRTLIFFILILVVSCACQPTKDIGANPSKLNHNRVPINIDNNIEIGISGVILTDTDKDIKVRSYGYGSVSLRGLNECGFFSEKGSNLKYGWVTFNTKELINQDLCTYTLESRSNILDAPAIGKVIVKRYIDPNVIPLKIRMNGITKNGVNWVQLKEQALNFAYMGDITNTKDGIPEGHDITVFPSGKKGKMIITGCDVREVYYYDDTIDDLSKGWRTTIDNLYKSIGGINKDCVFTITANNDDMLKESASFIVSVYRESGGFLTAPIVDDVGKRICFEFTDRNVVGLRVADVITNKVNTKKLCVFPRTQYEVEGITSNLRIFYGVYKNNEWETIK